MTQLITIEDVERVIKEFNKERINKISKDIQAEKYTEMADTILAENHELLREIDKLPKTERETEREWIPYNEPPKSNTYILLSFENFSIPLVGRYETDENGGTYYIGDEDETCLQQDMIVNAWRKLPKPYREQGE